MDMLYYEQPVFVLLPMILLFWQIFVYFLNKKTHILPFVELLLSGIGAVGHAVAILVILMNGGTLSDALLLVLLSGTVSLFLSPKANTTNKTDKEENN